MKQSNGLYALAALAVTAGAALVALEPSVGIGLMVIGGVLGLRGYFVSVKKKSGPVTNATSATPRQAVQEPTPVVEPKERSFPKKCEELIEDIHCFLDDHPRHANRIDNTYLFGRFKQQFGKRLRGITKEFHLVAPDKRNHSLVPTHFEQIPALISSLEILAGLPDEDSKDP